MKLFDVYPLMDITPVSALGCYITDKKGEKYLDLYGGHAVISIGHSHPHYVKRLSEQLNRIGFYSNSVINPLQSQLAEKLGQMSGLNDYQLFLCNSGAEANENALKLASFTTGKQRIIAFNKAFHGRTSVAVGATDNPAIQAPINQNHQVVFVPLNDSRAVEAELKKGDVCAIIVEGIQGVGGVRIAEAGFLKDIEKLCRQHEVLLIMDEVQSGYGRSGRFFAFQEAGIRPDLITTAKGMGNGFPIGAVMIAPHITPRHGMLGTTFGGNYLACAAAMAVLEVMDEEKLIENARDTGAYLLGKIGEVEGVKEVRGRGLMIGIEFDHEVSAMRKALLQTKKIFTGVSSTNIIRLLPPLTLTRHMADAFVKALAEVLEDN